MKNMKVYSISYKAKEAKGSTLMGIFTNVESASKHRSAQRLVDENNSIWQQNIDLSWSIEWIEDDEEHEIKIGCHTITENLSIGSTIYTLALKLRFEGESLVGIFSNVEDAKKHPLFSSFLKEHKCNWKNNSENGCGLAGDTSRQGDCLMIQPSMLR